MNVEFKRAKRDTDGAPGIGTMMATVLVVHLICCGGTALLFLVGGGGLLGLGVAQGSVLLLAVGVVAVGVGAYWRAYRRREREPRQFHAGP